MKIPQVFEQGKIRETKIQKYLKSRNKNLKQDKIGNLYIINKDTPLICAHMDTVGSEQAQTLLKNVRIIKPGEFTGRFNADRKPILNTTDQKIIMGAGNIGADDKCGIAIAMELYEQFGDQISLLFTVGEETGGRGIQEFDKKLLKQCTYAIIPDRMNGTNFIGEKNDYCSTEFEDIVLPFLEPRGFADERGMRSDCDTISDYINCFNISVGYYLPHTDNEYVSISEFENTYEAITTLLQNFNQRLEKPNKYTSVYSGIAESDKGYNPGKRNYPPIEVEGDMLYCYQKTTLYGQNGIPITIYPGDYYIDNQPIGYVDDSDEPKYEDEDELHNVID